MSEQAHRLKYDAPQGTGRFELFDPEPNNHHSALYLVDPNGAAFNISCWNEEGIDKARGEWMRDALNVALSDACKLSPDAPYVWRLDRGESETLFAALHGLTCSRDIQDIPLVMESVTDIFRSTTAGDGSRQRPLSDFDNIAESITNSDPLMSVFAAVEWDELDDNGKDWVRALVRETMARVSSGYVVGLADAADEAIRVGTTSAEDTEHPATSRAVGRAIASTIRSLVPALTTTPARNTSQIGEG